MKKQTRYYFNDGISAEGGFIDARNEKELNEKLEIIKNKAIGKLTPKHPGKTMLGNPCSQKKIIGVMWL